MQVGPAISRLFRFFGESSSRVSRRRIPEFWRPRADPRRVPGAYIPPMPDPAFEFKPYYLGCLSQASYLLGSKGEAAVVDPRRDVDVYIDDARSLGLSIRYVIETHLHADFVSGHRELAERTGATILISHRAGATFPHTGVKDGDIVKVGDLRVAFLETPGHTPESVSVLVSDTATSDKPAMVLTGDTLFIGDVGRPDLLGSRGVTAEQMGGVLYDSLHQKLMKLDDDVLVYPAHGAGSLCGKNLSKDTVSTIGRERKTNVALQPMTRDEFVRFVTADAPEIPRYFPVDVDINRRGAPGLEPGMKPAALAPSDVKRWMNQGAIVLDVRPSQDYAGGYIPGSLNIGLEGQFASWAGTLVDTRRDIVIVATDEKRASEARLRLARVGLESVRGWLAGGVDAWRDARLPVETLKQVTVEELQSVLTTAFDAKKESPPQVVDVRRLGEWNTAHIKGAVHAPLHALEDHAAYLDPSRKTYVICGGGFRSVMGAEILKQLGVRDVVDVKGGMSDWCAQGLPVAAE